MTFQNKRVKYPFNKRESSHTTNGLNRTENTVMPTPSTQHPNWKKPFPIGTERTKPNGRVIVKLGRDHHLSDKNGWASKARLVMEQVTGWQLRATEDVRHNDGNQRNNDASNLKLTLSTIPPGLRSRKRPDLRHQSPLQLAANLQFFVLRELLRKHPPKPTPKERRAGFASEPPKVWLERVLAKERDLSMLDAQSIEAELQRAGDARQDRWKILRPLRDALEELRLTEDWLGSIEKWLHKERLHLELKGRHAAPRGIPLRLWRPAVKAVERSRKRIERWWLAIIEATPPNELAKQIAELMSSLMSIRSSNTAEPGIISNGAG